METNLIDSPEEKIENFKYADFGIRLLALIIDTVIYFGIAYLIWGKEVANTSDNGFQIQLKDEKSLIILAYYLVFWLVFSNSPGKMICGLKIIGVDGNRMKPVAVILRLVGYIILIIGGWFILGNKQRKGLHDMIAGTLVIHR